MFEEQGQRGRVDIGRVIERTFGVIGSNFLVFAGLSVLLTGLPTFVVQISRMRADADEVSASLGLMVAGSLVNLVTSFILQGALVHGAVVHLAGKRASFSDLLATGIRVALPLVGISILLGLAIGLGMVALIVPGLILATMWAVAVPAEVVERTGVFGAFTRSRTLTRGHRWAVFGLLVLTFVVSVVISMAFGGLGAAFGPPFIAWSLPIMAALGQALAALIGSTGVAALYFELRQAKEGVGPDALAAVFA